MPKNKEPLKGKVAKIISSRELAINIGKQQGVKIGMIFKVLYPDLEVIIDPDTKEKIGSLERCKVKVKISIVQDRLSIGKTYKKIKHNIGGKGLSLMDKWAEYLSPPEWIERYETFSIDEKDSVEELPESKSYVKRGDPVVQILHPEDEEDIEELLKYDST